MPFLCAACGLLPVVFGFLSSAIASAANHKVSCALDVGDIKDTGTVTCDYKSDCKITSTRLKLSFTISGRNPVYRNSVKVEISDDSGRWDCCYFADGMTEVSRDTTDSLFRFGIYVGRRQTHPRRTSEYLVNEPFGILYLQFSDK